MRGFFKSYHLALLLPLVPPYKRKRLKADIQDRTTMLRLTNIALPTPSPTWLQNFPYILHIFIHCSSGWPNFASVADCAAAATADTVMYAITCPNKITITKCHKKWAFFFSAQLNIEVLAPIWTTNYNLASIWSHPHIFWSWHYIMQIIYC